MQIDSRAHFDAVLWADALPGQFRVLRFNCTVASTVASRSNGLTERSLEPIEDPEDIYDIDQGGYTKSH
jgi:hypothetical protein